MIIYIQHTHNSNVLNNSVTANLIEPANSKTQEIILLCTSDCVVTIALSISSTFKVQWYELWTQSAKDQRFYVFLEAQGIVPQTSHLRAPTENF